MKLDRQLRVLSLFKCGYYTCSKDGHVYSFHNGRHGVSDSAKKLKPIMLCDYWGVALCGNGDRIIAKVHQAVFLFFNGKYDESLVMNHKNGNKLDNRLVNLELVSVKKNNCHAIELGLWKPNKGEKNGRSKLTRQDVLRIRALGEKYGPKRVELARMFGVSDGTIRDVLFGRSWK